MVQNNIRPFFSIAFSFTLLSTRKPKALIADNVLLRLFYPFFHAISFSFPFRDLIFHSLSFSFSFPLSLSLFAFFIQVCVLTFEWKRKSDKCYNRCRSPTNCLVEFVQFVIYFNYGFHLFSLKWLSVLTCISNDIIHTFAYHTFKHIYIFWTKIQSQFTPPFSIFQDILRITNPFS